MNNIFTLPYPTDPSLPANVSPIFSDLTAARGDHLRANNAEIWANLAAVAAMLTYNEYTSGPVNLVAGTVQQNIVLNGTAAIVVNLPAASGSGNLYEFSNINTGLVSITPNG